MENKKRAIDVHDELIEEIEDVDEIEEIDQAPQLVKKRLASRVPSHSSGRLRRVTSSQTGRQPSGMQKRQRPKSATGQQGRSSGGQTRRRTSGRVQSGTRQRPQSVAKQGNARPGGRNLARRKSNSMPIAVFSIVGVLLLVVVALALSMGDDATKPNDASSKNTKDNSNKIDANKPSVAGPKPKSKPKPEPAAQPKPKPEPKPENPVKAEWLKTMSHLLALWNRINDVNEDLTQEELDRISQDLYDESMIALDKYENDEEIRKNAKLSDADFLRLRIKGIGTMLAKKYFDKIYDKVVEMKKAFLFREAVEYLEGIIEGRSDDAFPESLRNDKIRQWRDLTTMKENLIEELGLKKEVIALSQELMAMVAEYTQVYESCGKSFDNVDDSHLRKTAEYAKRLDEKFDPLFQNDDKMLDEVITEHSLRDYIISEYTRMSLVVFNYYKLNWKDIVARGKEDELKGHLVHLDYWAGYISQFLESQEEDFYNYYMMIKSKYEGIVTDKAEPPAKEFIEQALKHARKLYDSKLKLVKEYIEHDEIPNKEAPGLAFEALSPAVVGAHAIVFIGRAIIPSKKKEAEELMESLGRKITEYFVEISKSDNYKDNIGLKAFTRSMLLTITMVWNPKTSKAGKSAKAAFDSDGSVNGQEMVMMIQTLGRMLSLDDEDSEEMVDIEKLFILYSTWESRYNGFMYLYKTKTDWQKYDISIPLELMFLEHDVMSMLDALILGLAEAEMKKYVVTKQMALYFKELCEKWLVYYDKYIPTIDQDEDPEDFFAYKNDKKKIQSIMEYLTKLASNF